jgi:hypothetical protein
VTRVRKEAEPAKRYLVGSPTVRQGGDPFAVMTLAKATLGIVEAVVKHWRTVAVS